MPSGANHIRRHLHASDAVSALLTELERRESLLGRVRALLPASLAAHCVHAAATDGRLVLCVDSPVWVDRLRFLAPQLATELAEPGQPMADCQVKVQPASQTDAASRASWYRGSTSPEAIGAVDALATQLDRGPLADSLRRLADTLRR